MGNDEAGRETARLAVEANQAIVSYLNEEGGTLAKESSHG